MGEPLEQFTLRVNGAARELRVPARRLLSDALRHDLRLTGTHVGCEHGVCGCCTVLLDGAPVRSCLMFAVSAAGHDVTTVEGLTPTPGAGERERAGGRDDTESGAALHPIQQAFQDCHGLQCGFCTPGFVMSVAGLLAENPDPSDDEIVEGISGNLCRCTGYRNIIRAVRRAADLLGETGGDAVASGDSGAGGPSHPSLHETAPTPYAPPGDATPAEPDEQGMS